MSGRVVLGMSSTVDDEVVWDAAVVSGLVEELGLGPADLGRDGAVDDLRGIVSALLGHVAEGSGAEHYVTSPGPLAEFVSRFAAARTLGGTGVRAGIALAATGVASTAVMAAADPDVHRLLPPLCTAVATVEVPALVPHLIVQYPAGTTIRVGDRLVVAPAPNRVIFAHDVPNEELAIPPQFAGLVAEASVVLVSSLNAIRDEALLARRIDEIAVALQGAPAGAVRIWEDAGYHVAHLALRVVRELAAQVDVVSMNEDELQSYLGERVDLLDADQVARGTARVRELVGARTLLVHTRWWSVAVGDDAPAYRAALRGGISMASARYAYGDAIGPDEYREAGTWPSDPRSLSTALRLEQRGLVCEAGVVPPTSSPTTIGLGDAFAGGVVKVLAEARAAVGSRPDAGAPPLG